MSNELFKRASRMGLRFNYMGSIDVTDVWKLPLTSTNVNDVTVDSICMDLHTQLEASKQGSFVTKTATSANQILQLQFDVAKAILDTLVTERNEKEIEASRESERQRLDGLILKAQANKLADTPIEELEAMRAELDK